jgi:hypothetical protein
MEQLERIAVRTEPRGRTTRPITDVASAALGKEEMAVRVLAIRDE